MLVASVPSSILPPWENLQSCRYWSQINEAEVFV